VQHRFLRLRHAATVIGGLAVVLTLGQPASAGPDPSDSAAECTVTAKLVPTCGRFLGVAAAPQAGESYDQAMINFENRIDRTVDIAHYYTTGQSRMFPSAEMVSRANEPGRERIIFVNWRPTITWRAVANGAADTYLRNVANHIRAVHPTAFFLSLHAEMEPQVNPDWSSGMTATDFRNFFRHTVQVLRANGAGSVVTVMNYMGAPHWPDRPWFESLYPGDDVVDWIAEDPYAFGNPPIFLSDFAGLVNRHYPGGAWPGFYTWATANFPGKPIMLAEWGVDEKDGMPGYKPEFFNNTLRQLQQFPALKALVYWDHPGGIMVGETRVNSSPATLQAFTGLANSWMLTWPGEYYLGRPSDPD